MCKVIDNSISCVDSISGLISGITMFIFYNNQPESSVPDTLQIGDIIHLTNVKTHRHQ
jgi:hypothetical protein